MVLFSRQDPVRRHIYSYLQTYLPYQFFNTAMIYTRSRTGILPRHAQGMFGLRMYAFWIVLILYIQFVLNFFAASGAYQALQCQAQNVS